MESLRRIGFLAAFFTLTFSTVSYAGSCGSQKLVCGEEEKCCEHTIATFSEAGSMGPSYVEGRCVAKASKCGNFWCGNRNCQSGFFGTPTVCCISEKPGLSSSYQCAYSELSCKGNTQQLTIRASAPADHDDPLN